MSAFSAVTIKCSEADVVRYVQQAGPPLSDEGTQISYAAAPGDRGTEVRVMLAKSAPGGAIGQKVAAVMGTDPQRQLDDALRRLKQLAETGETLRSDASPGGTDAKQQRTQGPARPARADA